MSTPTLYIAPHYNRDGNIDGYDVREKTATHDVIVSPCDSQAEADDELARLTDDNSRPIQGRVTGSVNGPATLHPDGRIEIHPTL